MNKYSRLTILPAVVAMLAVTAISAHAQVTCNTSAGAPLLARGEGKTEYVSDLTLTCTGGTPTAVGQVVPAVNFTIFLNTDLTSRVTAEHMGADFSEALLLVDEPNTLVSPPQHPVLNCGNVGAADSGPSGPGVCIIISDGTPAHTYDGTQNIQATTPCDAVGTDPAPNTYACGRPNAFQGRMIAVNEVVFFGVPFDPPGAGVRIFRFTNIRGNAFILGPGPVTILEEIAVNGSTAITINNPQQTVADALPSMTAAINTPGVVHVSEGFAGAFKVQNVAMPLANGTFSGGTYVYNGGTAYPPANAQNVPGAYFNFESMFEWQNDALNAPPSPNPPAGFCCGPIADLGHSLDSFGFGIFPTNIQQDGIADSGTRIALTFPKTPGHATVTVPAVVNLQKVSSPGPSSGVLVLTSTDSAGAGPFTPSASVTIPEGGTAVYEVLFADPFAVEFADIPVTVNHPGKGAQVSVTLAPFYNTTASNNATPTSTYPAPTAIPRFNPNTTTMKLQ